jgi:hypothetical protein
MVGSSGKGDYDPGKPLARSMRRLHVENKGIFSG